jgi:hypothetical protein
LSEASANSAQASASTASTQAINAANYASSADARAVVAEQAAIDSAELARQAAESAQLAVDQTGTQVKVANVVQQAMNFASDPQAQLDSKLPKAELLNLIYPIGSIYMSVNNVSPQAFIGGSWIAWGAGRVPLAIGSNGESNYAIVEQAGGSENSVASHNHIQNAHTHTQVAHNHTQNSHFHEHDHRHYNRVNADPSATSGTNNRNSTPYLQFSAARYDDNDYMGSDGQFVTGWSSGNFQNITLTTSGGSRIRWNYFEFSRATGRVVHEEAWGVGGYNSSRNTQSTIAVNQATTATNNTTTATNQEIGSVGGNRQPVITCYMWKRTA